MRVSVGDIVMVNHWKMNTVYGRGMSKVVVLKIRGGYWCLVEVLESGGSHAKGENKWVPRHCVEPTGSREGDEG